MQPIPLDDAGMIHIFNACRPLPRDRCDDFLRALASELAWQTVIGPGLVFRTITSVWPKFFVPPDTSEHDEPGGRIFHTKMDANFWDRLINHS
jgi:hypothetical protein